MSQSGHLKRPEPDDAKVSRPVLRGGGGGNTASLPDDALSVRLHLVDGAVAATYRYGPFGEVVGEGPEGYGYTGEQWDHTIKMTFLRARYYQPETGRFISRDLWAGELGWPITLQRFLYVINNPLRFIDPSGLQPWLDITTGETSQFGDQTGMGATGTVPDPPMVDPHENIGYRNRPLPVEIEDAIKKQAPRYGLPWQIVAGVIACQWNLDTDLSDTIQDQLFLQIAINQPDIIDKMYWGGKPQVVTYRTDYNTLTWERVPLFAFTLPVEFSPGSVGIDMGPGYASIHLSTAYATVNHFRKYYRGSHMEMALAAYSPSELTIGLVSSDEFTARYASAVLRMLADYRFGHCGFPALPGFVPRTMSGWTMADAVAMWHGWRYGVKRVSPKAQGFELDVFQNRHLGLEELMQRGQGINPELNMRLSIPFFEHYFLRFD